MQRNELCRARIAARDLAGRDRVRLHHAHAHPGAGDSRHPRRPRHHGRRPDRHRQDRRFRPADPAEAGAAGEHEPVAGAPSGARADPRADARARDPGRGADQGIRQVHEPALDRASSAASTSSQQLPIVRARRRDPRRHARPPARSRRAEERQPRPGRDLRARRSRPDARHGLHPRHQADHGAAA